MKPASALKTAPPSKPGQAGSAPVAALERPQNLKKWASDLCGILQKEEKSIFEGWDFGPGALTRVDFGRILKKISGCGSVVELRAALDRNTGEMGDPVIHAANFCGQHSVCPFCAGRVQDRRAARFRDPIQAMARKYPHAYMVTATIPPVPTWREDLERLIGGWQTFRRMGQKRGGRKAGRSAGEWGKVRAGIAKIELKRGEGSGLPHCHYHALFFTDEMLDFRLFETKGEKAAYYAGDKSIKPLYVLPDGRMTTKINWEWFKATGGTATNLKVQKLKYKDEHKARGLSYADSVFEQSREVLKYATKFDSNPEAGSEKLFARDFVGIRDATYNRRLFITYGDFRHVGGNDFEGGGPHISEQPAIFETRWRQNHYSPLVERTRPIFPNSDASPAASERLRTLNRVQGEIRRIRFAVVRAKAHYFESGHLAPAVYSKREYLAEGGFNDFPVALEIPAQVLAAPGDPATWEAWLDELMANGRDYYSRVKEGLALDSLERIIGTKEERQAQEYREWILSVKATREHVSYADKVIRSFREVLDAPGKMIPAHPS